MSPCVCVCVCVCTCTLRTCTCTCTTVPRDTLSTVPADACGDQTFSESQNILDQLSLPIKNAFGKDVTPDHRRHVLHVEHVTADLQDRKSRCDELADVRRLKLEQILQMRTCDQDAAKVSFENFVYFVQNFLYVIAL